MELNEKEHKFCIEYIKLGNCTDSAINAGYSPKTAYSIGSRLLKKVEIIQFIESERKKVLNEVKKEVLYTFEKGVQMLFDLYNDNDNSGTVKLGAVKELNSMYGFIKVVDSNTETENIQSIDFSE